MYFVYEDCSIGRSVIFYWKYAHKKASYAFPSERNKNYKRKKKCFYCLEWETLDLLPISKREMRKTRWRQNHIENVTNVKGAMYVIRFWNCNGWFFFSQFCSTFFLFFNLPISYAIVPVYVWTWPVNKNIFVRVRLFQCRKQRLNNNIWPISRICFVMLPIINELQSEAEQKNWIQSFHLFSSSLFLCTLHLSNFNWPPYQITYIRLRTLCTADDDHHSVASDKGKLTRVEKTSKKQNTTFLIMIAHFSNGSAKSIWVQSQWKEYKK